ncbi:MAG: hypothetical protein HY077_00745 [Elusimicrobia bacterium]|nr:hypothetical protein [Elusimicrobiota bacterium]
MKWYLLHPIAVHFPIALLCVGLAACALSLRCRAPEWLGSAVSWLLWLGTLAAWSAMGLGLLAQKTAPHVPPAWEALADHKELGFWTVGLFTALSIWRKLWPGRWRLEFALAWLLAAGVLLATAYQGGRIVYEFGMGVGGG